MNYKKIWLVNVFVLLCILVSANPPKYVFYFIGDGMGINHVEASIIYQSKNVKDLNSGLIFSEFPVAGILVTRSASNYITDSSAAGTALATGYKTNNNVVGLDTLSNSVSSIISRAQKQNWMTGVITSVSIDDATPATFYAHAKSRKQFYEIGRQATTSGINFFGGAGFKTYTNKDNPADPYLLDLFKQNGYNVYKGIDDYSKNKTVNKKAVMLPAYDYPDVSLPYAIDRQPDDMSLEQLTSSAIEYFELAKAKKFMIMIEGGQIDHAAHQKDGASVIQEVIDLSKSVKLAYDFYLKHPKETLIVLTADHETGGLSLGKEGGFNLSIHTLKNQIVSQTKLSNLMSALKEQRQDSAQWEDVVKLLKDNLGFWDNITIPSKDEKAMNICFAETFTKKDVKKVETLYSKDEPLAVMAIEILNRLCSLGWTTKAHTGAPVPVFAIGVGSENFTGRIDNTSIPQKIAKLINLK